MKTARPLSDHLNELILRGDWLFEAHLLVCLLDRFYNGFLLILEVQGDEASLTIVQSFDEDWTCMQEADIDLRLVQVLLIKQWFFKVLQLFQDHLFGLQFVLTTNRIRIIALQLGLSELLVKVIKIDLITMRDRGLNQYASWVDIALLESS